MRLSIVGCPVVVLLALLLVAPVEVSSAKREDELCVKLRQCLESLLGRSIEPPDDSSFAQEQFCDMLVEIYQGEAGVNNICAVAKSGSFAARVSDTASPPQPKHGLKKKSIPLREEATVNAENGPTVKKKKKKKEKKLSPQSSTGRVNNVDTTTAASDTSKIKVKAQNKQTTQNAHQFHPPRHLAAPPCELPFNPVYADQSGVGTPYDTYMLSIQDLYLLDGKLKRSDSDAYASLKIGWATAHTAAALATEVPGAATLANEALSILEISVDQVDTHDSDMDSVQIEAAFENTQKILAQTCRMISHMDRAERNFLKRFDNIDNTVKVVQTRLDRIDNVLNRLERDSANIQKLLLDVLSRLPVGKVSVGKGKGTWKGKKFHHHHRADVFLEGGVR